LITNAVVHGFDEQSSGKIDITVSDSGTDKVNIAISDNGKGIPSALHKKIFEPFFTTKRNHGGSGLGLQIVYNLVTHNLGGSITLQSQDGEGSTFSLEIPRHFNLVSADIE
jgi:signal transduction histidine kinase